MKTTPLARFLLLALIGLAFAGGASAQVPSVGLSTVRSQRFHNENLLGFYTPQEGDQFGFAVAAGDFNGDGIDDLATGIPFDDGLTDSPIVDSGSVVVRFGVAGEGLSSNLAGTVLRQVPFMNPPEAKDRLGEALAACDFNGDGFDDLAISVDHEDHVDRDNAGAVQVHYGSSVLGINFNPEDFYAQSSPGIPGVADDGQFFGATLACGDFNADGFADLVASAPRYWIKLNPLRIGTAGMIVVTPGSAFGLDHHRSLGLDQDSEGVDGDAEDDLFGFGLGVGDFNGDGFDDLAVGSPAEDDSKGAIHVFFGGSFGVTVENSLFWMETFIGGSSEDDDWFGEFLAADDFDGDGFDDLVVSIAEDDLGLQEAELDAGRVAVIYGSRLGPDRDRTQFWSELEILGPATSELDDLFGQGLATGDFDRDGFADLAIGHPGETLGGPAAGQLTILMGSATGLTDARTREIAAGLEGMPGTAGQSKARFAHRLAAGDFDGDGHADLAIGIPEDDVNGTVDVGSEAVLYGALFADGVDTGDTSMWSQTVGSPTGNRVEVTNAARLGPAKGSGRFGLSVTLPGSGRTVGMPTFVRVGPERGFANDRVLSGSFFINPQNLTMSNVNGQNVFQFMAFDDGVGPGSKSRLAFDLVRAGTFYAIVANFHNEAINGLQAAGAAQLTDAGDPLGTNLKIDFEWRAGSAGAAGQLTLWLTRFSSGAPDAAGKVQLFSAALPNTANAVINAVSVGMVTGQDLGTVGQLFLDELSFRR